MSEAEYQNNKLSIEYTYYTLDHAMDDLGFLAYRDGAGDFGTRRLFLDDKVYEVRILHVVQDYWTGEYPDNYFYILTENGRKSQEFNTKEELNDLIFNKDQFNYKLIKK